MTFEHFRILGETVAAAAEDMHQPRQAESGVAAFWVLSAADSGDLATDMSRL